MEVQNQATLSLNVKIKSFSLASFPSKNAHYDYVKVLGHISSKPLKVKSALPNTPSTEVGGLREKDFTIRKILDFSWEDKK